MCVKDEIGGEEAEEIQKLGSPSSFASSPMERICENTVSIDDLNPVMNFVPIVRSGEWFNIGAREHMEDTHVCISDLAKKFRRRSLDAEAVSFYGVFDGHGGKDAAHFVCDNLPRIIAEDSDFPLKLEKVIVRSFLQTDLQFAKTCSPQASLPPSGTTALVAMIFGRSLLVANAGDCRAVLSRLGVAIEMSKDHRPCCARERHRVESLGGFIDDGYLNGQLGVTRALGDWHLEGMKVPGQPGGPLIAEPELNHITLSKEDEFLIIGSDGLWDVFSSQNAVDFARRRLQQHNDVKACCKDIIEEALKRGADDNLTVVMLCFHADPPMRIAHRGRLQKTISAEGLNSLKSLLEEKPSTKDN
ncbi:probable protein phosphatase 2C 27 isoform X2 [Zingiber officinale]|uniref:protein-serine/threonine phosphatase n=1 Tax=Zingiber officinale TaxID=94328 RepID=A0A8J5BDH8_ZINOF|nr:probable protein phosphatase 2C 27 isoform X2 [Zingiber officinale]KAG6469736.1 hypothetical protein ZIOFF_070667 [Zingiber officinale]